jgi:hypothetical protein
MQTDNLLAPLVQLGKALRACIIVPHAKTMRCFDGNLKIAACRVYKSTVRRKIGMTRSPTRTRSRVTLR